ncbi:transposase [Nocardia rhizosphaerihabitans]|uniref:transposase n=1 Tax=Nocardia rhizosphaerihabitans TaxID=1691570 RepID=UPI00366BAC3C
MQLRSNFRVYPTPRQQVSLAQTFGCARVVYNDALAAREAARAAVLPYVTDSALSKALTASKDTPEREWLAQVSSVVLQQALAAQKGSVNRAKARADVARAHARVADTRKDWAHKYSTAVIRDNQAVYVEDLCVKGLARTRLAKSIHDAGWGMFTRMLGEKAARYGRVFGKVDRFFPSTRMCSVCEAISEKKPLHVREWMCTCGTVHDRDMNAANNILAAGRADRLKTPAEGP